MSMPEQDIIKTTFSFLSLLNVNQIDLLKPTEQLIYTMMAFLGKDCTFLEEEISSLLSTFVKNSFTKSSTFNLDDKFRGEYEKNRVKYLVYWPELKRALANPMIFFLIW